MSESNDADQDMTSMFASVWVKVEVGDSEEDTNMSTKNTESKKINSGKRKQTRPRRYTKTLQCDSCDYTTNYKNSLELHMISHNTTKPYACNSCNYTTKYPTSLHRHVLIQHEFKKTDHKDEVPGYKCDLCPYTTFFKWNLNAHRRKHNLEKKFKCELCSYATAYRHNYMKHSKVHNKQEVIFKCDKCPFVTKFEGHISRHLAKIHNEVSDKANKCDFCDFSTKVGWRLNIHKQRSKQNDVIKCALCEFESNYMCEYKKHKVVHYKQKYIARMPTEPSDSNCEVIDSSAIEPPSTETFEDVFRCDSCDYSTKEVWRLTSHKFKNKQDDVIKCSLCEFVTNYKCGFKKHRGTHYDVSYDTKINKKNGDNFEPSVSSNLSHEMENHYTVDTNCGVNWKSIPVVESKSNDHPFQCIKCKYTSRFKASVQRHFQRHHTSQNKPYKCCNCDFSTKTKDQISLHNKRSRSETQLRCSECEFTTFFKCQHVMHQKGHYAHKCNMCDYSCKQKYEFQKHFATVHMGEGIQCRFCDYKATRKESLLCHETIHTGNKPFSCTYCDYKSVRKTLLYNHIKRYHSDIIRNETVVVSDSKIESLKITLGDKLKNQNVIQEIREHNLTIEDLLNSGNNDVFDNIIDSAGTNNDLL